MPTRCRGANVQNTKSVFDVTEAEVARNSEMEKPKGKFLEIENSGPRSASPLGEINCFLGAVPVDAAAAVEEEEKMSA